VTIVIDPSALRARERMFKKYGASLFRNGPRFAKSITTAKDNPPRLCIEGLGITFDTPILNKYGEAIIFGPNSFDEYFKSSTRPPFWQSHDATTAFGANTELCILNEGVAFRLDLTNVTNAAKIEELVMSGHDGISIGFTELKTRNEVLFGHPVKMIDEAEIREISLVPRGACKQAFCRLIDANNEPPLHESVNSDMFGIEYGLHNIKIIKEDNEAGIDWIERKLQSLQAAAEYNEPQAVVRSLTADHCSRIETERYARLQSARRTMLGM
jgi:HK97 family phage prohead protease